MKRITLKLMLMSILLLMMGLRSMAVPAYPHPIDYQLPDGTTIKIQLMGDERVRWAQTPDGYSILVTKEGYYEYAIKNADGDMIASGVKVSNINQRSFRELSLLSSLPKNLFYSSSQIEAMNQIWEMGEKNSKAFPTTGNRKLVCILIGFTDKAFTKSRVDFDNLFNQVGYNAGGATGSVKDYYLENSYGQFNLTVDVFGPYTASQNMAYYGANDANGNDVRPRNLVTEAVNLADPQANFANYDNDNDGTVDGVYIVYAGYGEEAGGGANAIWAHAWNISPVVKDGKTISKYSCSAELRGNSGTTISAIGVICHEFGHVLGAPDYYDTNYGTGGQFEGTGSWDMMAGGSWNNNGVTPAHHNAFTKIYFYNWATPTVLSSATNVTLQNAAENSNSFYRINTNTSGEYFLLENREKHKFDAYLPGSGMMIYHVHSGVMTSSSSNTVNTTHPQRMYPKVASATTNPSSTPSSYGSVNSAGCPWPGSSNKTSFTDATTPNMKSWAGANTAKPITNISRNATDKTVSFAFMGGSSAQAPTATTQSATSITTSSATLNGQVNANGTATTVTFEWGTSTSLGNVVNASPSSVSGTSNTTVSASLSSLAANTTYYYRLKAVSSAGTTLGSIMSFTTVANPSSVSLPLTENFNASSFPSGWTTQNTGSGITERWSMSNTANAGGAAYELRCSYQNINPGTTRFITPAINTVGVSQINLSFRHMFDDYGAGATLRIQSSKDKVNWTNESWSLASVSNTNIGPLTVQTTISSNLNSSTTYIAFVIEGNLYQFDYWYIDNVSLVAATPATAPTVSTNTISNITSSSATAGGNVSSDGGASVTERGVVFATTSNPTIANNKVVSGSGTGSFSANLSGLSANTTYYVRAYAINSAGTSYGSQQSFTTSSAAVTYCASKGNNSSYEWIDLVQFAGINRTSGNDGGYINMTSMTANVARGTTYPIYFSAGFQSSSYTEHWAVWIDFNQNGVFEDTEKVVTGSSSSSGTLSANITIPSTALLGTTRMRVSMKYNAAQTACETFSYGEVEDYSVNINQSSGSPAYSHANAEMLSQELIETYTVYPNPVSDVLHVSLIGIQGKVWMRIYDLNGRMVVETQIDNSLHEIPVSHLEKGIYIIRLDEEKEAVVKRFLKL